MQRFFLKPEDFKSNEVVITDLPLLHQIKNVLRMRTGDRFVALDGEGAEFLCEIKNIGQQLIADIIKKRKNEAEPEIFMTLFQAMPKKMELFEFMLQKCTELGVGAFVPLIAQHTERAAISKRNRLEKILREAAEQSERGKIPTLAGEMNFQSALNFAAKSTSAISILLHGRGNFPPFSAQIQAIKASKICNIFIGPEGGFSEQELEQAAANGLIIASLGPRILRTETAAIAAASQILSY